MNPERPDAISPQTLFDEGLTWHNQSRLDEAQRCYEAAIARDPSHFPALHMLGAIHGQKGEFELAVALIDRAIAANPNVADTHFNRGLTLSALDRPHDAVASYEAAIKLNPHHPEPHVNRGADLTKLGRTEEALASFDAALALRPDHAAAHNNRGAALYTLGRYDDALASYEMAIALRPDYVNAHNNRGMALHKLERPREALASFERAVALRSDHWEAQSNRAFALLELKRYQDALASSETAIALKPDHAVAHNIRGTALHKLGCHEEALASYDAAIALHAGYDAAHANRGVVLYELNRLEAAVASYDAAIALDRGRADIRIGDETAVDEGLTELDRAIGLDPGFAEVLFNRSVALLAMGDLKDGFAAYRWRWRLPEFRGRVPALPFPQWEGESLTGRAILIHCEQGLGDSLHFIRYVKPLAAMAARVVVIAQPPLVTLFGSIPGVDFVTAFDGSAFDYHAPLMCLPRLFGTTLGTIPAEVPYLAANSTRAAAWQERFADFAGRLKVGLVWAGDSHKPSAEDRAMDRRRSIRLEQLAPLARAADVQFVSLQKGDPGVQSARPPQGMRLIDPTTELHDFADTAALVADLDLVITVDTSVAHLAGALAKPVWILSRFDGCWRWLNGREDSPWYPTARLFHQKIPGDWDEVVQRVAGELDALAGLASRRTRDRVEPASSR